MLKNSLFLIFCLAFLVSPLQAPAKSPGKYSRNPAIPLAVWQQLEPFFLPTDHPIKAKLDRLFRSGKATSSKESFETAGFAPIRERAPTNIVIGRHPQLKGYLIKAFLDTQPLVSEWIIWLNRIQGAESIRQCIKRHHYTHFVVPRKWIYPLPNKPSSLVTPYQKYFILIVEDMDILDNQANMKAYQKKITPQILNALYVILNEEGLIDSVYPDNIPFTRSGKIAFIDTEHYHKQPVQYLKLKKYFSPAMQQYWQTLVETGNSL